MAIDRDKTLRQAEKLLRQGKLDQAIAEYARVVDAQPRDWNTVNALGDLYVRSGQIERAVEQFRRIADNLRDEGFHPKALALYKKILKAKPDDEAALLQAAEVAVTQRLFADAKTFFRSAVELRRGRGDSRGAAEIAVRAGSLDPTDFELRLAAARGVAELGDRRGAVEQFKLVAADLVGRSRAADAIEPLREAAALDAEDAEVRDRLLDAYLAVGDLERAREYAASSAHFRALADALSGAGREEASLDALGEAARLDPGDVVLKGRLARAFVARGAVARAAEYLTDESAGDDVELLMLLANVHMRAQRVDEGRAVIGRVLAIEPRRRAAVASMGCALAEDAPEAGYACVEMASESAVVEQDWTAAANVLEAFAARQPGHVPALLRLVEICVDGDLDAALGGAQALLADAYVEAGLGTEARVIAEDLMAREPDEQLHVERLRRALKLLGERDPERIISERLSDASRFAAADLMVDFSDLPPLVPAALEPRVEATEATEREEADDQEQVAEPIASTVMPQVALAAAQVPIAPATSGPARPDVPLSASDRASTAASVAEGAVVEQAVAEPELVEVEVDLSGELGSLGGESEAESTARAPMPAAAAVGDLEGVFQTFRDEAARQYSLGSAADLFERGLALKESGRLDEAAEALEIASKAPGYRFEAAWALARLNRDRDEAQRAIEWFERGALAPPPSIEAGHQLLFELADMLERTGEVARALAVCLELQSDAGEYRDLAARVDRLSRSQAEE